MLIDLTENQIQHIQAIKDKYAPELARLKAEKEASTGEDRKRVLIQIQAQFDLMESELDAYADNIQRERFNAIGHDPEGILEDAREQTPKILKALYDEISKDKEAYKKETATKKGVLYIKANHAADWIKSELRLHVEELRENKDALQRLFTGIIEAVEASPLTDDTDIASEDIKANEVMRFRRSPLADIQTYGIMNDKANAQLLQDCGIFHQEADGQLTLQWAVNQAPKSRDPVPVYISLKLEDTELGLSKKLNAYDSAVYNAISNIFYYWKLQNPERPLYITPQEVWRRMNGKQSRDGSAKPGKAQINKICKSIEKMRHIDFFMDISEEIKAHYVTLDDERLTGGYIKDYLLNCGEAGFVTEQGREVKGYRIHMEPILYTYNAAKDHVLFIPFDLLDTSKSLSDTENVTEFKTYLLQQIQLMKNGVRDNKKILLSTIYRDTGIQTPEERAEGTAFTSDSARLTYIRKTRKADRQKIEGLLEAWKGKAWIKGYTALNAKGDPVKERQPVHAYSISI